MVRGLGRLLRSKGRAMYAERSETEAPEPPDLAGPPQAQAAIAPSAISVRGRSILALVVAPDAPLEGWLAGLDRQIARAADLFAHRPIIADLAGLDGGGAWPAPQVQALDALAARSLWVIGAEGVEPDLLHGTPWARLPTVLRGRDTSLGVAPRKAPGPPTSKPAAAVLIERTVRSGQTIVCKDGDVVVVGAVASGAEVIAGGS